MQPPKSDICVLCASCQATTHDHVPPKGLFKGTAVQLITVPACGSCNNGASSEDEDLRFFVSAQVGKQTPASAALWDKGAHKSIRRKTKLRNTVLKSIREVETINAQGNRTVRLAFDVPIDTYRSVLERTTRGLYFFHTGRILPRTTSIDVKVLDTPDLDKQKLTSFSKYSIGDDACIYHFGIVNTARDSSLWLYEFYKAHWIMVATGDAVEKTF